MSEMVMRHFMVTFKDNKGRGYFMKMTAPNEEAARLYIKKKQGLTAKEMERVVVTEEVIEKCTT